VIEKPKCRNKEGGLNRGGHEYKGKDWPKNLAKGRGTWVGEKRDQGSNWMRDDKYGVPGKLTIGS